MRTLCLNLQRDVAPSVAENFLTFSPRVHYRAPGLVFLDITDCLIDHLGKIGCLQPDREWAREI